MEGEHRRSDDRFKDEVIEFIKEGRSFRGMLEEKLGDIEKTLLSLEAQAKITNGRVNKLDIVTAPVPKALLDLEAIKDTLARHRGALTVVVVGMPIMLFVLNKVLK